MVSTRETRAGFTLPEAIIALTISSVLVLLVGSVFLVQNDFYAHIFLRSQVQENARTMSEIVAGEIRSVAAGGVLIADSTRLVARGNMVTGLVCGRQGSDLVVHLPGGTAGLDTAEVAGFGYRTPSTGAWTYSDYTWSQIKATGGSPAQQCAGSGADTTGISSQFVRMKNYTDQSATNALGYVVMLYRKTEFRFNSSALISGDRSLYWGVYGQTLRELVTGMATNAHFQFRTGANTWAKYVASGSVANINGIRVSAQSIGKGETSSQASYAFGWTVDIPLANAY